MNWKKLSALDKASVALIFILLACLLPMPYGYYQFVRFASLIIFACLALRYYEENKMSLAVTFGALVLLFQPFFKVALGRSMWNIVDVVVAIGLGILILSRNNKTE